MVVVWRPRHWRVAALAVCITVGGGCHRRDRFSANLLQIDLLFFVRISSEWYCHQPRHAWARSSPAYEQVLVIWRAVMRHPDNYNKQMRILQGIALSHMSFNWNIARPMKIINRHESICIDEAATTRGVMVSRQHWTRYEARSLLSLGGANRPMGC